MEKICHTCRQIIDEHGGDERAKETVYEAVDKLQGYERKRIVIVFTHRLCEPPYKIPPEKLC